MLKTQHSLLPVKAMKNEKDIGALPLFTSLPSTVGQPF